MFKTFSVIYLYCLAFEKYPYIFHSIFSTMQRIHILYYIWKRCCRLQKSHFYSLYRYKYSGKKKLVLLFLSEKKTATTHIWLKEFLNMYYIHSILLSIETVEHQNHQATIHNKTISTLHHSQHQFNKRQNNK